MVKIYGHSSDLTSSGVNKFYLLSTARPKKSQLMHATCVLMLKSNMSTVQNSSWKLAASGGGKEIIEHEWNHQY